MANGVDHLEPLRGKKVFVKIAKVKKATTGDRQRLSIEEKKLVHLPDWYVCGRSGASGLGWVGSSVGMSG